MSRFLHIAPRAQADVRHIFRWLERRAPRGAATWYTAFWKAAERIASSGEIYGVAPEADRLNRQLHQAIFKTRRGRPYRIVFEMTDTDVVLLRVRGPGQAPLRRRDIPDE